MKRLIALVAGILFAAQLPASDHIDGPVTTSHRVGDLTDLFAFPTPGQPGFLTIILDAYPLVPSDGHFSDKVHTTILVRRAAIREAAGGAFFETSDEVTLDCTFATPEATADHVVRCRSSNGLRARSRYQVVSDEGGGDFRLYAGMRADPFFFNADFASDTVKGKLDPPDDSNVMRGGNILAIVIEIDLRRLYSDPPAQIAVAAETTTRDAPGAPLRRLDRVGRPEFTNVSLAPRDGPDLRDRYNRERSFEVPVASQRLYEAKLARNVAYYDLLDGHREWQDRDRDALAKLFAADFLVVDLAKPCPADSFLEIETSILRQRAPRTCGGRRPGDDIMDTLFTLYVAGLNGRPVRDGVDHPAAELSERYPYLAAPDLGIWSTLRVFLARKILGIPDWR